MTIVPLHIGRHHSPSIFRSGYFLWYNSKEDDRTSRNILTFWKLKIMQPPKNNNNQSTKNENDWE